MGQYQGTSGAAPAAAGRLRRPRGPPYENPGKGKGLNTSYVLEPDLFSTDGPEPDLASPVLTSPVLAG